MDAGTQVTVKEARHLANLLRKGTGYSMDQASELLKALGGGVKNLGSKVKPAELTPETTKAQMKLVINALNAFYREHNRFPESLTELPAGTPLVDPYSFRKQLRYSLNKEPPVSAVIISNGPDWKADYDGQGFNAAKPTSFPRPEAVYDPKMGKGDLYLYTTGPEAIRVK